MLCKFKCACFPSLIISCTLLRFQECQTGNFIGVALKRRLHAQETRQCTFIVKMRMELCLLLLFYFIEANCIPIESFFPFGASAGDEEYREISLSPPLPFLGENKTSLSVSILAMNEKNLYNNYTGRGWTNLDFSLASEWLWCLMPDYEILT